MSRARRLQSTRHIVWKDAAKMMNRRVFALSALLLLCVAAKHKPTTQPDVSQVYFQVQALSTLNELELTAEQLKALKSFASGGPSTQALQVPAKVAGQYS